MPITAVTRSVENPDRAKTALPRTTQTTCGNGTLKAAKPARAPRYKALLRRAVLFAQERLEAAHPLGSRPQLTNLHGCHLPCSQSAVASMTSEVVSDQFEDLNDFWKKGEKTGTPLLGSDCLLQKFPNWKKFTGDVQPASSMPKAWQNWSSRPRILRDFATFVQNRRPRKTLYKEDPLGAYFISGVLITDLKRRTRRRSQATTALPLLNDQKLPPLPLALTTVAL